MKDQVAASAKIVLGNINQEIEVRQKELDQLTVTRNSLMELYGPTDAPPVSPELKASRAKAPALDVKSKRKYTKRAAVEPGQSTAARLEDKPDTLAGAMKQLARKCTKPFTAQNMIEALRADADFIKLLEASGDNAPYGNLAYWTKTGKLTKTGDGAEATYTVVNLG